MFKEYEMVWKVSSTGQIILLFSWSYPLISSFSSVGNCHYIIIVSFIFPLMNDSLSFNDQNETLCHHNYTVLSIATDFSPWLPGILLNKAGIADKGRRSCWHPISNIAPMGIAIGHNGFCQIHSQILQCAMFLDYCKTLQFWLSQLSHLLPTSELMWWHLCPSLGTGLFSPTRVKQTIFDCIVHDWLHDHEYLEKNVILNKEQYCRSTPNIYLRATEDWKMYKKGPNLMWHVSTIH